MSIVYLSKNRSFNIDTLLLFVYIDIQRVYKARVRTMVLNANFNSISVISWRSVLINWWRKPGYPEKTTDLSQVTDKQT